MSELRTSENVTSQLRRGYRYICLGCGRHLDWRGGNTIPRAALCVDCQQRIDRTKRWEDTTLGDVRIAITHSAASPDLPEATTSNVEMALLDCFPQSGYRTVLAPVKPLETLLKLLWLWREAAKREGREYAERMLVRLAAGEAKIEDYHGDRR